MDEDGERGADQRRRERRDRLPGAEAVVLPLDTIVLVYAAAVIKVLGTAVLLMALLSVGEPLWIRMIVIAACAVLIAITPSLADIRFGAPRRLRGTDLEILRPFRRRRTLDLRRTEAIAASPPVWLDRGRYGGWALRWTIVLAHPDGRLGAHERLERDGVPRETLERLAPHGRFIRFVLHDPTSATIGAELAAVIEAHGGQLDPSFTDALRTVEDVA